jgi:hypothetical protein
MHLIFVCENSDLIDVVEAVPTQKHWDWEGTITIPESWKDMVPKCVTKEGSGKWSDRVFAKASKIDGSQGRQGKLYGSSDTLANQQSNYQNEQ